MKKLLNLWLMITTIIGIVTIIMIVPMMLAVSHNNVAYLLLYVPALSFLIAALYEIY